MPGYKRPRGTNGRGRKSTKGNNRTRRAFTKAKRGVKSSRPSGRVRRTVDARAPVYPFTRNVSTLIQPWVPGVPADAFRLNNDKTFYVMSMRLQLEDLPQDHDI